MVSRVFKIINNDTGTESKYGVVDPGGKPPTGGGDGGMIPPLWKLDMPRDVQIAKWGLAGLLTLIGVFFWFVYLPDTKQVQKDIAGINTNVAVITKSNGDIQSTLDRVESRLDNRDDNHPQESQGAGQAGAVHSGAASGARHRG